MRIAVSGTHCSGKTTLIDEFLRVHSDYAHEPEPYIALQEDYGEIFAAEPSADDFYRQLEFNLSRLRSYKPGERVIYERSPYDFLAYMLALDDLGRERNNSQLIDRSLSLVQESSLYLDLVVFLPIHDRDGIEAPDDEDPELRIAVNSRLEGMLINDDLGFFVSGRPALLEAGGSTGQRLVTLSRAIGALREED